MKKTCHGGWQDGIWSRWVAPTPWPSPWRSPEPTGRSRKGAVRHRHDGPEHYKDARWESGVLESGMDWRWRWAYSTANRKGLRLLDGRTCHTSARQGIPGGMPHPVQGGRDVKGIYVLAEVDDAGSARALPCHAHDGLVEVTRNGEKALSCPRKRPEGDGLLEEIGR